MTTAALDPAHSGLLATRDGAQIYWEVSGNPDGTPMVWLHGGPGSGLRSGGYRRALDPKRWLVVGLGNPVAQPRSRSKASVMARARAGS